MVVGECARIWQVQSMRQAPRFVIARRPQADVAISGRHCPSERAIVKTATAPDLSLRGGHRPTWQSREGTSSSYKVPIKTYQPIASVAALTAQPLAALPPYGCGVPFTGVERLAGWQVIEWLRRPRNAPKFVIPRSEATWESQAGTIEFAGAFLCSGRVLRDCTPRALPRASRSGRHGPFGASQ